MRNNILPKARLPFDIIKGSVGKRNDNANKYNELLYKTLNPLCMEQKCSVESFKNSLNKVLSPYKIDYIITPEKNNLFVGSLGTLCKTSLDENYEFMLNYLRYNFMMPLDKEGKNILNKYSIFHEARHFFDRLFNPKQNLLRVEYASVNPEYAESTSKIHDLYFLKLDKPIKMKDFKQELDNLIKYMPNPIVIETLQCVRYSLLSEINAYKDELKFIARENFSIKNLKSSLIFADFLIRNCKFKSKLKYTEEILRERIKEERSNLKQKKLF